MGRLIAVAGFMGAGKSLVVQRLADSLNAPVVDGDLLAKELMQGTSSLIEKVGNAFGVVHEGVIDFKTLGPIVFAAKEKMEQLNAIVHPFLIDAILELAAKEKMSILDAALVPLWERQLPLERALWITAPEPLRISRIMQRNGFSKVEATERVQGQYQTLTEPKREYPWIHFENSGSIEDMTAALHELVRKELSYE